jgi:uncharacterized protein YodC (DUF2158 family)
MFKVGDVVELKSGCGPTMTVEKIEADTVRADYTGPTTASGKVPANHVMCVWFIGDTFARDGFPVDALAIHNMKKWEDKGSADTCGESDGSDDESIPL